MLSHQKTVSVNKIFWLVLTNLAKRVPRTAAWSSILGILSCLIGATLALPMRNEHETSFSEEVEI